MKRKEKKRKEERKKQTDRQTDRQYERQKEKKKEKKERKKERQKTRLDIGNPVADSWAGAVMRKSLAIQNCYRPTDRRTDRHGKV